MQFWDDTYIYVTVDIAYFRDFHENPNILWGWGDADWDGDTNICWCL